MEVVCTEEFKRYMARKGYTHVELGLAEANTCCSGFSEVFATFLTDGAARRVSEKAVRTIPCEVGDVLVTARGLEYDDVVTLGLKSFLGVKDITVEGVRAWSL